MKKLAALILVLIMLAPLCPRIGANAEAPTDASPQEAQTYAQAHNFQFVGGSAPMDYSLASRMTCNGFSDVKFDPDAWNYFQFQLVSVEPLAEDSNYNVYAFKSSIQPYVKLSGIQASESTSAGYLLMAPRFVDANTGYEIPQRSAHYSDGIDHLESINGISSAGNSATGNRISLRDVLNSPSFTWDGEEVHVYLRRSGNSSIRNEDIQTGDDGRTTVDVSFQVDDEYILILPAGYTGLCIGYDITWGENDANYEEAEEEDSDELELFEPEEDSHYYFRRLDEMAAVLLNGQVSGRTESGFAKSIAGNAEALAELKNIVANPDGTVQCYTTDNVATWSFLSTASMEMRRLLAERGLLEIDIAASKAGAGHASEPTDDKLCNVNAINRSTGLLVDVVAFDGAGNVLGRSGMIVPGEFISGFSLDKAPEATFKNVRDDIYSSAANGGTPTIIDKTLECSLALGAYVYDLDGNFLYYEIFSTL